MGYKYFDTPDGQDCGKKCAYLVKKAGVIGIYLSSCYVLAVETPPTYAKIFARFARITVPCIATAAVGAVSVCMLVDARKKDDLFNHLYGGILGGVAGGVAKGNFGHGLAAGIVLGMIAASYKECKLNNYDPIQQSKFKLNIDDHWSKDYDLRLCKQIPPDWVAK